MTRDPNRPERNGVLKDLLVFLGLVLLGLVIAAIALPVLGFALAVAAALLKLLVLALIVYGIVYLVSPETAARWREKVRQAFR